MDDLIEIYRRIEYLRNNGLKMKEIADFIDMAPSVLSALYSSVLPTYVTSLKQGHSEENSLDLALGQVNNISKKRLMGNLSSIAFQSGTCQWRDKGESVYGNDDCRDAAFCSGSL